jgi:predicted RNase H-like nuclease (RuvC/YqgF family)
MKINYCEKCEIECCKLKECEHLNDLNTLKKELDSFIIENKAMKWDLMKLNKEIKELQYRNENLKRILNGGNFH